MQVVVLPFLGNLIAKTQWMREVTKCFLILVVCLLLFVSNYMVRGFLRAGKTVVAILNRACVNFS